MNGVLLDGTKPSPEAMLSYHQLYSVAYFREQFHNSVHELDP